MAKTFSFSRHSRFVNQFKGKKSKTQESIEFKFKTNYKKNLKKHKALMAQQEDVAKKLKDIENHR